MKRKRDNDTAKRYVLELTSDKTRKRNDVISAFRERREDYYTGKHIYSFFLVL